MKWKLLGPVSCGSDNWEEAISRRLQFLFNWLGERDCYCINTNPGKLFPSPI